MQQHGEYDIMQSDMTLTSWWSYKLSWPNYKMATTEAPQESQSLIEEEIAALVSALADDDAV
jgi:hypothetical protein